MTTPVLPVLLASLLAAALALPAGTAAQEDTPASDSLPAEAVRSEIETRDRQIQELLQRIEKLEQSIEPPEERTDEAPAPSPEPPTLTEEERYEQETLVRAAFERTLVERGGLLLPWGKFDIEPGLSYVHSSSDRIVIDGFTILPVLVVGDIFSERVRRDHFIASATLRAGLPWDMQLGVYVPYRYESLRVFTQDNQETDDSINGLGDVEVALSYQLPLKRGRFPDLIAGLRWKSKTAKDPFSPDTPQGLSLGTGFNSFEGTLMAVKVSDPVVFFGRLSFTYNAEEIKPVGEVDPGDSYGLQMGMALALNLDTSVNFSYDQRYTDSTDLNGQTVPGSYLTTGTFTTGISYVMDTHKSLDVSVGIGLTRDSPDVQVNFSLPIRFSL